MTQYQNIKCINYKQFKNIPSILQSVYIVNCYHLQFIKRLNYIYITFIYKYN